MLQHSERPQATKSVPTDSLNVYALAFPHPFQTSFCAKLENL
jgi:hypothetical protein